MGRALRHTALIVEDDELQREMVSLLFEESEMDVIECASGEEAAAILERWGSHLTVLFTDIELAGEMTGVELAMMARQRFPHLALIVTSGEWVAGIPETARFMRKPWLPLELLREAERCRARQWLR